MYCSKCGKKVKENASFCDSCGASLKKNSNLSNNKNTSKKNLAIFLVVAIVVFIIGIIFVSDGANKEYNNSYGYTSINRAKSEANSSYQNGIIAFVVGGGICVAGFLYYKKNKN